MIGAAREHAAVEPTTTERETEQNASEPQPPRRKSRRGFASMDVEEQRRIASLGGKAAHEKGTAHKFTTEEAREAGRIGGEVAQQRRLERSRAERR